MKLYLIVITLFKFSYSLKVSLYYESLCYDSSRFITRQLTPNYSQLKNYIQLEFIPYGKATHNYVNRRWIFDCQHGPNECQGNKYQACALAQNSGQDKDLAFVDCVMRERNPADVEKIKKCAQRVGINWGKITKCATTNQGDDLLAKHGSRTYDLEPNISFVPTVVYDDQFDDNLQEMSLVDFAAVVCSKIRSDKPRICDNKTLPQRRFFSM
ncbi:Gamma-interferon-inducible lysosomal thiol reductase-like Protein [Tribolium castaneum]|uniref:Gamma-interferon-inducible lysosomal thiol reductase-like Protein n=1 Tax=Tribolium castaneum TaxID=7070 RepID=D6WCM4_TRICA|nr:Gamma-interferon-inducible lysosomal thiol reductase-like Protein [Tribolium castaneum]